MVSDELIDNCFCCDLKACCGECCVEGDTGAPLEPEEIGDLEDNYTVFSQYMSDEGRALVEENGTFDYDMEGQFVTPLLNNTEACAYVYYENGIAKCAIEKAFLNISGSVSLSNAICKMPVRSLKSMKIKDPRSR